MELYSALIICSKPTCNVQKPITREKNTITALDFILAVFTLAPGATQIVTKVVVHVALGAVAAPQLAEFFDDGTVVISITKLYCMASPRVGSPHIPIVMTPTPYNEGRICESEELEKWRHGILYFCSCARPVRYKLILEIEDE